MTVNIGNQWFRDSIFNTQGNPSIFLNMQLLAYCRHMRSLDFCLVDVHVLPLDMPHRVFSDIFRAYVVLYCITKIKA